MKIPLLCVSSLALLWATPTPSFAQTQSPEVADSLATALAEKGSPAALEELWRQAVLDRGDCTELQEQLAQRLQNSADVDEKISLRWVQSMLFQRRGLLQDAMQVMADMAEEGQDGRYWLNKGRLHDALNQAKSAQQAYESALALLQESDPNRFMIRLRLALLTMQEDSEAKDALHKFAVQAELETEDRNRAAVVLALLGRPADGIELFRTYGEGTALFRQEIRLAEWALKAKDFEQAQQYAWLAHSSAMTNRDRYYALAILHQAYRDADSLQDLLDQFASGELSDQPAREAWIALLREMGKFEQAVELFQQDAAAAEFPIELRRELLEMYRDSGREDEMLQQYQKLIEEQPTNWVWPEGLSRFYLENGDVTSARQAWQVFLQKETPGGNYLDGAKALMGVGMDDLAEQCAEACIAADQVASQTYLFLFDLYSFRGDLVKAAAALDRMRDALPPDAPDRMQLAESYERLGDLDQAVRILEDLRTIRGPERTGEDLEMRLAWLHSEVGNEELALQRWQEIWLRIDSIPRRRYVEDRLMSVASRLGRLADIAIELEKKLYAGTANSRESGLLVRLYTKVGDAVSATEIIEEHLKHSGGSEVVALQEQARVFLACTDYHNYERTVHQLIAVDPEGEPDYLRQIAMSMLERGKPQQARTILERLKEVGATSDEAEFEAGVLALAGLDQEAISAYRRGLAGNANRIESYLLLANLMSKAGQKNQAIGMFQNLAEHAERDDLFTIAIDGLINMEAPEPVLRWARRITLERLARRHDKPYLYQLLSDLAELSNDVEAQFTALENLLPIAGDRRTSVVRELMDLAKGNNSFSGPRRQPQRERHLAFGRRLVSLGQLVPPQVYLDLGKAFLDSQAIGDAVNTFKLARGLADFDAFRRDTADLFEQALYLNEAKQTYQKVLIGDSGNLGLLIKVAELHEQTGHDELAQETYQRAIELLLSRRPLVAAKEEKDLSDPYARWQTRNVDDFERFYERAQNGLIATMPSSRAQLLLQTQQGRLQKDLAEVLGVQAKQQKPLPLDRFPRLLRRVNFVRHLAITYGLPAAAESFDHLLLSSFPEDTALLPRLVRLWSKNGLIESASRLLAQSERPELEKEPLRFMVGEGLDPEGFDLIASDEALRLLMPMLTRGDKEEAKLLLRRVNYRGGDGDSQTVGALYSAATMLGDSDLLLTISRHWLRMQMDDSQSYGYYGLRSSLERCVQTLPPQHLRSYCQYYMQLVLEEPEKRGGYIAGLPYLQDQLTEPLLSGEELTDLISEQGKIIAFNLGPLLEMAPLEDRASLASSVWSEISPSTRSYFPFNLITSMEAEMGAALEDKLVEWCKVGLSEGDQRYTVQRGESLLDQKLLERSYDLVGRILGVMDETFPENPLVKSYLCRWMWKKDQSAEAVNLAVEAYFNTTMQTNTDWTYNQARRAIEREFFPTKPAPFIERWEKQNQSDGADLKRTQERLRLVRSLDQPELYLQELQSAMAWHDDEMDFKLQYHRALITQKQPQLAAQWFATLLKEHADDQSLWRSHYYSLRSKFRYEEASSALDRWLAIQAIEDQEKEDTSEEIVAAKVDTRVQRADVYGLKKALDEHGEPAAKQVLRRLWRSFPAGSDNQQIYVYRQPLGRFWPQDYKPVEQSEAELKVQRRGGLQAFLASKPQAETPPPPTMWEVLAGYEFGIEEMQRLLRVEADSGVDGMEEVITALAHARSRNSDGATAIQELLDMAADGRALRHHYLQLLVLLSEETGPLSTQAQTVLDGLQRSLDPKDGQQLLELARVMAATGDRNRAVALYRWCATRVSNDRYSYFDENLQQLSIRQLLTSAKTGLQSGDDLEEIIEFALQVAAPEDNPWQTENYQRLVLETWSELLDPKAALQKCEKICSEADSREHSLRRNIAQKSALLYAQSGQLERAISCMEVGYCSFPIDAFPSKYYYFYGQTEHSYYSLNRNQWEQMLPADAAAFAEPGAWFAALGNAVLDWYAEERLNESSAVQTAALAAVRCHDLGLTTSATQLLTRLHELPLAESNYALWIADAFAHCGQPDVAGKIQEQLLDNQKLNRYRWPEVLHAQAAQWGAEATLQKYLPLVQETQHEELLGALIELAEAAQNSDVLLQLQQTRDVAAKAKTAIEAWEEAEKKKREELQKKNQGQSGMMIIR
ncbi:MAG: tetratricopeptide repeat protein [Planctomycetes bacterium]|nr:tetratricopeptide repeat protein [Planctomycetota bacterium]